MSDKVKKEEELEEQAAEAADAPDAAEQLQEELAKAYEELAAANDKYLRLYAEYDNYRKRSDKEKSGIYASAYADAVKDILPIGDNLARASVFTDPESVKKGMAMILKGFDEALKKMGITEIAVKEGDAFDPELHNAVMHIDDEALAENTISQVFQKGFKIGDKIVRFAMVQVAN